MTMTRDQLRAARVFLHLNQPELADLAKMGVATLRRYEGGQDVGAIYADSLQRVVEGMGIVFLTEEPGDETPEARPRLGLGIAFRPHAELPADTIKRLAEASTKEKAEAAEDVTPAEASGASGVDAEIKPAKKPRGRPRKAQETLIGEGGTPDGSVPPPVDAKEPEAPKRRSKPKGKG